MKATVLIILLIVFTCNIHGQAKGKVFSDLNHNRLPDPGEIGIPGVLVSNGIDIVKTDKEGNYQINIKPGMPLFMVKPKNWMTPVDDNNLPLFYYLHKPEGSPGFSYPGSKPSGKLPPSINFPLYPAFEPDTFEIFVFGDPQTRGSRETEYLAHKIVSEIAGDTLRKFGISLGDIAYDDLSVYTLLNRLTSKIGLPWYHVLGNHDLNFDAPNDALANETFEAVFGPSNYAFQYAGAHFIVIDDVVYLPGDGRKYTGGFSDEQLLFIKNYLVHVPKTDLVVLCMHIPLFQRVADYYQNIETFRDSDRRRLFDILSGHPNTLSLSAHTHFVMQHFFTESDGWKQEEPHHHYNAGAMCGDWFKGLITIDGWPDATMRDGTPQGYTILTIRGKKYYPRYKVAGAPATKQMSVFTAKPDSLSPKNMIYTNFYMGSEQCKVFYRLNNTGEWLEMHQSLEPDPRNIALVNRLKPFDKNLPGKQISVPQPCHHLWKAPLPENLPAGFNIAEIKVIDRYKVEHTEKLVFLQE